MSEQGGWIERVKPSKRILHCQNLAVELSAVGVVERRRGRGGGGRIRVSGEKGELEERHNGGGNARME